jgi:ubiquinone/menaquinone biosynthesis C-methylase UbiE
MNAAPEVSMRTNPDEALREWEQAEIRRSNIEAGKTTSADSRSDDRKFARYRNPPAETPYPLEYAYHLVGNIQGKRVLDFGCGSGANSMLLARRGAVVCGVDISHDLLAIARDRLARSADPLRAGFVAASAHDLPLEDGSFDLVFGIAILHHLDLKLVSKEVHRVLKPGGRAIFQEPVRNSRLIELGRRIFPNRSEEISPYEHPLTSAQVVEFAAPFRKVSDRAFTLPHVRLAKHLGWFTKNVDPLYRLDAALLKRYPRLSLYSAVRVIELAR